MSNVTLSWSLRKLVVSCSWPFRPDVTQSLVKDWSLLAIWWTALTSRIVSERPALQSQVGDCGLSMWSDKQCCCSSSFACIQCFCQRFYSVDVPSLSEVDSKLGQVHGVKVIDCNLSGKKVSGCCKQKRGGDWLERIWHVCGGGCYIGGGLDWMVLGRSVWTVGKALPALDTIASAPNHLHLIPSPPFLLWKTEKAAS